MLVQLFNLNIQALDCSIITCSVTETAFSAHISLTSLKYIKQGINFHIIQYNRNLPHLIEFKNNVIFSDTHMLSNMRELT